MTFGKQSLTLLLFGFVMVTGVSCVSNSKLSCGPPALSLMKDASANVRASQGKPQPANSPYNPRNQFGGSQGSNLAAAETPKPQRGSSMFRNPITPLRRDDSPIITTAASTLGYGSETPDTSFNFPSMVGSNLLVRTTAYCHKEADSLPYGKKNAAGGVLQYGPVVRSAAADWSRFPLGTKFRIHGQPYEYVIDDYGSALVGTNTIDLYKPTFTAMNEWGARNVPIQILEWGCFQKSHEILESRKHVPEADHVRQMLRDIENRYSKRFRTVHAADELLGPVGKPNSRA